MAIDKRGSSLGKNRSSTSKSATASASASKDGGASSSAGPAGTNKLGKVKDTKDKPWSRRVQEAPKPLAAGAGAGGKKRKAADEEVDKVTEESVEQPTLPATAPTTAKPTSSTTASTDRKKKAAAAAVPVLSGYHSTSEDDEEDSSDDDDEDDEVDSDAGPVPGIELSKLPTVAKDDASVKRKLEKAKKANDKEKGVLYLGRIPHGFYEKEMKAYFEQFGDVEKIRLARNKKTGKSKHYAFLLLSSLSVAKIVAETMDNYLLLGHILRCKVIPNDQIHPDLWIGANRKWRAVPSVRIERHKLEQPRSKEQQQKAESRLLNRQAQKKAKLEALGIDYDLDSVAYKSVSA